MPRKQPRKGSSEHDERNEQDEHREKSSTDRSRSRGKKEQNRIPQESSPALSKIALENEHGERQDSEPGSTVEENVHADVQADEDNSPSGILTPGMVAAMRKARKEKGWSIRKIA